MNNEQKEKYYIQSNNLTSFKEYCTCGGYAREYIQGKKHEYYCPQLKEINDFYSTNAGSFIDDPET